MLPRLGDQRLPGRTGAERDDLELSLGAGDDVERLHPDRAGRAEDYEPAGHVAESRGE
jgi:hypothetical protein